jgi:hypothetical protein
LFFATSQGNAEKLLTKTPHGGTGAIKETPTNTSINNNTKRRFFKETVQGRVEYYDE